MEPKLKSGTSGLFKILNHLFFILGADFCMNTIITLSSLVSQSFSYVSKLILNNELWAAEEDLFLNLSLNLWLAAQQHTNTNSFLFKATERPWLMKEQTVSGHEEHAHTCVQRDVLTHKHTSMHTPMHTCTHMYVHTHMLMRAHVHTPGHNEHTYTHVHTHKHIYTYTHAHLHNAHLCVWMKSANYKNQGLWGFCSYCCP